MNVKKRYFPVIGVLERGVGCMSFIPGSFQALGPLGEGLRGARLGFLLRYLLGLNRERRWGPT